MLGGLFGGFGLVGVLLRCFVHVNVIGIIIVDVC